MKFERTAIAEPVSEEGDELIRMSISSETDMVERYFGIEILRHTPDSVDLSRLSDGRHPLLVQHDANRQVGVIKEVALDSGAKKVRIGAKFSRASFAQEIKQDIIDEIRTLVSCGYSVEEVEEVRRDSNGGYIPIRKLSGNEFEREMRAKYGDNFFRVGTAHCRARGEEPPIWMVTRWQPFEGSVVPIPADTNVGIGRSAGAEPIPEKSPIDSRIEIRAKHEEIKMEKDENGKPLDQGALEAKRRDAIIALGEQYNKYVEQKDIFDALRNGRSVEQFKELIMEKMQSKHTDTRELHIGMTAKEFKRYSLGRALQAAVTGDWKKAGFELECSRAVEGLVGRGPEGFYVPFDIWRRDFNVGTSSEAGNLVPTDLRTDMFLDVLRNNLVMGKMGVTILAGLTADVDLPRKSTASTLGMLTEIGSAAETNPLTTKVTLQPHRIGAFVQVSKQAIIQSAIAIENMIRDDLMMGAAVTLEDQYMNGSGTSPNIIGLRNASGIGTTTAGSNGAAPAWSHFVGLETGCAVSNAEPDRLSGYVMNAKTRGKLKQTQMGTNLPFIWQPGDMPVNGYRVAVTNMMPSNLTKGTSTTVCSAAMFGSDWSMLAIGLFGAPDITVDPYSLADTGQVKITLNQFADAGVRQPAAFTKIDDLLSN